LYRDEKTLNALEDRMDGVISRSSGGQHLTGRAGNPNLHVFAGIHIIDRAWAGRFSGIRIVK
jgi:hypothetical protein